MIKRKLNKRPHYKVSLVERVAGNYYPITNKISIEDKRQMLRMSVLTDRSQGGSSLKSGEIELMVCAIFKFFLLIKSYTFINIVVDNLKHFLSISN